MVLSGRHTGTYSRVLGGAMSHDGFHPTSLDPSHREIRRCYQQALSNAKVFPSEVAYLNAHGPGTAQCDAAEGAMLDTLLTEADVYSIKPLVGHCQGAASAVELAATCMAYETGIIAGPAPGGTGPSPAGRRPHAAPRGPDAQVLDRHGWPQLGDHPRRRVRRLNRWTGGALGPKGSTPSAPRSICTPEAEKRLSGEHGKAHARTSEWCTGSPRQGSRRSYVAPGRRPRRVPRPRARDRAAWRRGSTAAPWSRSAGAAR